MNRASSTATNTAIRKLRIPESDDSAEGGVARPDPRTSVDSALGLRRVLRVCQRERRTFYGPADYTKVQFPSPKAHYPNDVPLATIE